jgi:hypothetical protein
MLEPKPFKFPELPHITLYPDSDEGNVFYALPEPHIVLDETGQPQVSLVLYGRKEQGVLQVQGGQFSLTLGLTLEADKEHLLRQLLAEKVKPQQPRLSAPQWHKGQVEVRLMAGVVLTGTPSLIGSNEAIFMKDLSPQEAKALEEAWSQGFPDSMITYVLETSTLETSKVNTGASSSKKTTFPNATSSNQLYAEVTSRKAVPYRLELSGAFNLPAQARPKEIVF